MVMTDSFQSGEALTLKVSFTGKMLSPKICRLTIVLMVFWACAVFLDSPCSAQESNSSLTLPEFSRRSLSNVEIKKLVSRFGPQGFRTILRFQSGWRGRAHVKLSKFVPSPNEAQWFVKKSSPPSHHGHISSECLYRERREYRQLTSDQRLRFHRAVRAMKNRMIDGVSHYDLFVHYHRSENSPAAHGGAAFLPWHREYLNRFENALREHDPCVSLPYWDSELDHLLPEAKDSIIWSNDYMGDQSGPVTEGPFSHWGVIRECRGNTGWSLVRNVGQRPQNFLLSSPDITDLNSHRTYQGIIVSPREFEDDHGGPHIYVGGQMGDITCSPSDPIFWMHHAFIDRLWEDFRQKHQTTDLEREYPTHSPSVDIGGTAHNPFAPMRPFTNMVNIQGLSREYTRFHYHYAPRPIRCSHDLQCGPSLWCHHGRCMSKVKYGGICRGFPVNSQSPCERGRCVYYRGNFRCLCRRGWHFPGHSC